MKDDSLPDVADLKQAPMHDDKELITELKRRGYKVYPEKRVRIYEARSMISYRELYQAGSMRTVDQMRQYRDADSAKSIGMKLMDEGAMVRSRRDADDSSIYGKGEIRTAQVCVVLPNDWDFESEMWGIR